MKKNAKWILIPITLVCFQLIIKPGYTEGNFRPLDLIAILDGYGNRLTQQNLGPQEDEPVKIFLTRLNELFHTRSSVKTRFLSRDEIAAGARSILLPGESDVALAVVKLLKAEGYSYAMTADVISNVEDRILLQLYITEIDPNKNEIVPKDFQNVVALRKGADVANEANHVISEYLGRSGEGRSLVTYFTCVFAPSSIRSSNEMEALLDRMNQLKEKLTIEMHTMRTLLGKTYVVKGMQWGDVRSKCIEGNGAKFALTEAHEVAISGQLAVDMGPQPVVQLMIIVDVTSDDAQPIMQPIPIEIKDPRVYQDDIRFQVFESEYAKQFKTEFCRMWKEKMPGSRELECK
jgi:hypothetical protein